MEKKRLNPKSVVNVKKRRDLAYYILLFVLPVFLQFFIFLRCRKFQFDSIIV